MNSTWNSGDGISPSCTIHRGNGGGGYFFSSSGVESGTLSVYVNCAKQYRSVLAKRF